jgi:hypothetical protein
LGGPQTAGKRLSMLSFLLAVTQAAAGPALPPPAIVAPAFERVPTDAEAASAYPAAAEAARLAGEVRMRCAMTALLQLSDCRVLSETPEGYGFAAAALSMAPFYRLRPDAVARGMTGRTVDLGLRFDPPKTTAPATSAPDPAPRR